MKTGMENVDRKIQSLTNEICSLVEQIPDLDNKIDTLNFIRMMLHKVSPLKHQPVDFVAWEKTETVEQNNYNPNRVAPPEMKLLVTSIEEDGYTMPVVTSPEDNMYRIVDGFHRRQAEKHSQKISQSTHGRLPVTFIRESQRSLDNRMTSTVRHNRARGSHDIDLMSNIVRELVAIGKSPAWISKHVGMEMDEILRLKQLTGIASLFADKDFSFSQEDTES